MQDSNQLIQKRLEADRKDLLDLSLRNPLLNYRPRVRDLAVVGDTPSDLFRWLVLEARSLPVLSVPRAVSDREAVLTLPESKAPETATPEGQEDGGGARENTTFTDSDESTRPTEPEPSAAEAEANDDVEAKEPERAPTPQPPAEPALRSSLEAEALQARVLAMSYAARTAIEEQGVNTLFLALGILEWIAATGDKAPARAPLILVPVELDRSSARDRFRVRYDGEDLEINLSLAEKLRVEFGVTLPELPEADALDLNGYFDALAEAVADRPRWGVDRTAAVLGFFSFNKFLMYRDLDPGLWPADFRPEDHPILRALLGDGFQEPVENATIEEALALDQDPGVADLRLVVDADSTQTLALLNASAGRTLVIQGPPGTGKSQTITNLIADAVGRGKTVLFVAEKLAALEVVKRRLDGVGLGQACLELHSHKLGKKAVLEQIRQGWVSGRPRLGAFEEDRQRRDHYRDQLNAYCKAINTPIGSSGLTPYQAIGDWLAARRGAGIETTPDFDLPGVETWSGLEFERRLQLVDRLQRQIARLDGLRAHPFWGSRRESFLPGDESRLRERLRVVRHATHALREASAALARFLRLPTASSRHASETLLLAAHHVQKASRWQGTHVKGEWLSRQDDLASLLDAGAAYSALRQRFDKVLSPHAWEGDLSATRQALNAYGRRWWGIFINDYRRARLTLAGLCRTEPPRRLDDQLALIDAIDESRQLQSRIKPHDALAARLFGRKWRGEHSDWAALRSLTEGMQRLHTEVRDGQLPRGLLDFLAEGPALAGLETLAGSVESALSAHDEAIKRLFTFLEFDEAARFGPDVTLAKLPFDEQLRLFDSWNEALPAFEKLIHYNRLVARCREEGLASVIDLAESWSDAKVGLTSAFQQCRLQALLRLALRDCPALADFEGEAHDQTVSAFRTLDERCLIHARSEIAMHHFQGLPRHQAGGQLALLRRELAKKTRHLPVRQLIRRAGNAVQRITPVFLMSPLSVASFLPPDGIRFDLVVFDEASQVRPVEALGALLRGSQAVVVGDSRQLPPTRFFDRLTTTEVLETDEEAAAMADIESLLDLFVMQGAPERMLRWHYRSRHESLIAVSNQEFYDNRLVVFPSPDADRRDSGLILRHLPESSYDRGGTRTNPGEAEAVAEAVLTFAKDQLDRPTAQRLSLGVATFSVAQQQAILDRLEQIRRDDSSCEAFFQGEGDEPFFVKNLESVQGDERDVIFLSVGYGRAADKSVTMNFGPLNTDGGERRLNVLITRARVRCEVFTNLRASDLDSTRIRARGVQALKSFLAFAEGGPLDASPATGTDQERVKPSAFERSIRDLLEHSGIATRSQVGPSGSEIDLAVLDPELPVRYQLGIECDGPGYATALSARDRDRLRPFVLERLGWRLARLWSLDWLREPDDQLQNLCAAIADPESTATKAASPEDSHDAPEAEGRKSDPDEADPKANNDPTREPLAVSLPAYQVADLSSLVNGSESDDLSSDRLTALVHEIVRVESPVHRDEVSRRIAEAIGKQRRSNFRRELEAACAQAVERGSIQQRGEFLWTLEMNEPILRDRTALPSGSRRLELVAPEELALALEHVVSHALGMDTTEVASATTKFLGFPRLSDEMRERIESIQAELLREGRLRARDGQLFESSRGTPP